MTVLRVGAATDSGRARAINQDSFVLLPDLDLFVVADGMGGHQGGEVASRLAVDTLRSAYQDQTADALTAAVQEANRRIYDEGGDRAELHGMGTTLVAAALVPEEPDPDADPESAEDDVRHHLLIANVGDSRAYLFREGDLLQLTDLPIPASAADPAELARIFNRHLELGLTGGLLVSNPVSQGMDQADLDRLRERALADAAAAGIQGRETTPWLLARIAEISDGLTVDVNLRLLRENSALAARLATELAQPHLEQARA